MDIPKAVFDANLFLSFLLSANPRGTAIDRLLEAAASQRFELQLPVGVIIEVNSVADRPRLSGRVSHRDIERLLRRVSRFATILPLMEEELPRICRDPNDDFLVAAAVLHGADFIVTRDHDLLELEAVLSVRIVDPTTFLELLQGTPE